MNYLSLRVTLCLRVSVPVNAMQAGTKPFKRVFRSQPCVRAGLQRRLESIFFHGSVQAHIEGKKVLITGERKKVLLQGVGFDRDCSGGLDHLVAVLLTGSV
jgi:hypothetical protein